MKDRDDFLKNTWEPHTLLDPTPQTPTEFLRISEDLKGDFSTWVMGRWRADGSALYLDGEMLPLAMFEIQEELGFSRELWRDGDWLAWEVFKSEKSEGFRLTEVQLLAPCEGVEASWPLNWTTALQFQNFLGDLKSYFLQRKFIEVHTPSLVLCPGTEVYLDPFKVEGVRREVFFLPTSPEIHLKKALAQGRSRIFEVKSVFRAGEVSNHHRPEFHMLEWYRVQVGLGQLERDVLDLMGHLSRLGGGTFKPWKGEHESVSVGQLFSQFIGKSLKPETSFQELRSWCRDLGIEHSAEDSWSDLFHRLFLEKIERALDPETLYLVRDYPPQLAAYARINSRGWADRLEVYWRGLELGNGFYEVCSAEEQTHRMVANLSERTARGAIPVGLDPDFIFHLKQGFPAASGIAMGAERLFMSLAGLDEIQSLKSF